MFERQKRDGSQADLDLFVQTLTRGLCQVEGLTILPVLDCVGGSFGGYSTIRYTAFNSMEA